MNVTLRIASLAMLFASPALAVTPSNFSNGFEVDIAGWDAFGGNFNATRVASGTNGVTSASGSFHAINAVVSSSPTSNAGNWGGYTDMFAPYSTSVDVYLDMSAGYANDTRSNFNSAISTPAGAHRRDFAFNFGFYDSSDLTGPGAGTDRFIFSASNNTGRANSVPNNPGRDPVAVATTGWYTLTHDFRDNGSGILEVELTLIDPSAAIVNSWLLSDPSDVIGSTVGGNRYGWFTSNEIPNLAFDNTSLSAIPEPSTIALAGLMGLAGVAALRRRQRSMN